MWDLIVSVPDHCLSFYAESKPSGKLEIKCGICGKWYLR